MRNTHRLTRLAAALATGIIIPSLVAPLILGTGSVHAAPAAPASPASDTYTVVAGDSLYSLARRMGVSLDSLLTTNGLTLNSLILPGRVLAVPTGGTVPTTTTKVSTGAPATSGVPQTAVPTNGGAPATTYTIKAGDYFFSIARRHGVSLDALLAANNLSLTSIVHPGTVITVPAGGRTVPSSSTAPSTAPSTGAAAPATGGAPGSTYTVQRGDGFFGIAMRHGVSLNALLAANNFTIHSIVHPGSTIAIPAGGRLVSPAATPAPAASPVAPSVTAPAASPSAAPASNSGSSATSSKADAVVAFAWAQLGKPYQFAAAGPDAFDCSGLTTAAYRQVGVWLPQQSGLQSTRGTAVDWTSEEIRPGDLVFTIRSGTSAIGHVGIAISSTQWIHAPRAGDVVKLGTIPSDTRIAAVRRFV